ncbi:cell wall biosynthesis glycosyltransferase [Phenylobacterium sp.]|uniref:cell wall biosynthesis glycosyltransferase n=1 Tax=Phenylobacterium sp. TaxID=1871053 RepID=UPI0025FC7411|nr:cell wall biosynthesis glycosyltransferase [Phenylobacterium sp.]
MVSVIIDARIGPEGTPALLAQLTAGAVDGLVRQVLIVAAEDQPGIDALCEDMGAEAHQTLEGAAQAARADTLMILPADFRLRDGWIKAIEGHLARGGEPAVVSGFSEAGLFGRRPFGVLLERDRLEGRRGADLQRLRRDLGLRARRIG